MSYSPIARCMMENRKAYFEAQFFKLIMQRYACCGVCEQHAWMVTFVNALCQHLPDAEMDYLISVRSLPHFIKSLRTLLEYGDIDIHCLELCYAHVRHQCACETDRVACLAPHRGQRTNLL